MKTWIRKSLSLCIATGINLLPFQGLIPIAQAGTGSAISVPSANQPQVLILLDNSQGMAGVIQGPDGLSGAIMSGSGTVKENQNSSSPINYLASSSFTPPAQGSPDTTVPYSVKCSSSSITALARSACSAFQVPGSSSAYVDNSESMFNVAENSIRYILNTQEYSNNIQFGLETYGLSSTPSLYNTWVYYMSDANGFSFGSSPSGAPAGDIAVPNPCYGSFRNGQFTNNSCSAIYYYNYYYGYYYNQGPMKNLYSNSLYSQPYLYVQDTSDNPIINDVVYALGGAPGNGIANVVASSYPYKSPVLTPSPITLSSYETKGVSVSYQNYTNSLLNELTPTSAGYVPQSRQVWASQRGYGFNASTQPGSGTIKVPISVNNAKNSASIAAFTLPEVFSSSAKYGSSSAPVTASAGYAPVAGAFQTAVQYYSTAASNSITNPPPTCGKKYVIFITFGQPTQGLSGNVYPPLGGSAATGLVTSINSASDWQSTNNNAVVEAISSIGQLYKQDGVKTYIIGVGSAVNANALSAGANATAGSASTQSTLQAEAQQGQYVLQAMANAGGTNTVYSAISASQLQSALNNIVANILGKAVVSSYASPPSVTVGSLEFLLKNVNPVSGQGDLYAYPVTSTGAVSSTEAWTANQYMSTTNRTNSLYTTPVGQTAVATLLSVASTTSSAFAINTTGLTASTIANYTINPSYNGGQYLGGRQSGWYVGLPSSAPAEVLTPPNNANLIANGGSYVTFVNQHSARQNAVLFSDNDGFLYALGYANTGNPTLLWGWMPGALLPALQQYKTFWQGSNMGNFGTIDASPDNGKTWHTYVIGTANLGSVIYDLQLSGTSAPNLQSVVKQVSNAGYSQPQASAPVFYQVQNPSASNYGTTWALFALNQASTSTTGSSASSALGILNVTTGAFALDPLPFANTATPYIDQYGNLFLGDSSGNVYEMSSSNLSSLLTSGTSTSIANTLFTSIGNYAPWAGSSLSANVQYIGGSFYQGYNYLRVQGPSGITMYQQTNGNWAPLWTVYSGGAGSWSGGTYTSLGSTSSTISALPSGSSITDQALINEGSVIVPVTIPPSSNNVCGVSTAAYYIYKLNSGAFPAGVFTSPTGAPLTQGYVVGQGSAFTPAVTVFNGKTLLQGAANQNTLGGTSGFASALGSGSLGGPIAWRIIVTLH